MEEEKGQCYEDISADDFRFYLEETKAHEFFLHSLRNILPSTFKRCVDKI